MRVSLIPAFSHKGEKEIKEDVTFMEGRSPEFSPKPQEKTDDGFSEKKLAKTAEGVGNDTSTVKKRKPVVVNTKQRTGRTAPGQSLPTVHLPLILPSRKEKIVTAYKKLTVEILPLLDQLSLLRGDNLRQEEQLVEEIKHKRHLQEELITALVLELKDQLSENALSKEAWDLVK